MSDYSKLPPIAVSLGGFAFNGEHIEYWKAQTTKADREIASLRKNHQRGQERFQELDAEIASLRAQLEEAQEALEEEQANAGRAWRAWEALTAQLASARKALEEIKSKGTTTGYGRTALARIAAMTLSSLTDEKGTS